MERRTHHAGNVEVRAHPHIKKRQLQKTGMVEGQEVGDILLDTGCSRTLVRRDLVPREKILEGEVVAIRCAHGDTVLYPIAQVDVTVGGQCLEVEAAVSETLPMSVLLGTDVSQLGRLLDNELIMAKSAGDHADADALAATTRSQKQRQETEELRRQEKEVSSFQPPGT